MSRQRVSIRTRATVTAALTLALTVIAGGVALVATFASQDQGRALSGSLVPASAATDDLLLRFTAQQTLLRQAVTSGNVNDVRDADIAGAAASVAAARIGVLTRGDPLLTARLAATTRAYRDWAEHVGDPQSAALRRGDIAAARALQSDAAYTTPYVLAVRRAGLALQSAITARVQAITDSLDQAHVTALAAIIAMIVVSALFGAEVITGVWLGMFKPFRQMAKAVDAVAGGSYGTRVPTVGPPEIAELSRGVELMRTRLVAALAEQERARENVRRLFDMAPDAIIGVARDGVIVTANAQAVEVFGYPAGELIGRPAQMLVPEESRPGLTERIASYYAEGPGPAQRQGITMTGLRRDAATFPGELRRSTLPTENGTIIMVSVRDVTERVAMEAERERLRAAAEQERLQQRLRQSQRLESLGQLVGGVAHDFNNLLGVISGYTDFAAEQLELRAAEDSRLLPVLEDVEQVQSAAQQAVRLTRQLLTFAKSKAVNLEVLDINDVVRSAGELLRRSLGPRIELVIEQGDGLPAVEADRGQLEQVLMNLGVNARDAMPDGGRLTISTASAELDAGNAEQRPGLKPGRYCMVAVSDTGTGMDAETIERVFEPFFSTKPRGRGTGLGLATVYGIVSGLGGTIDIYSTVGLGTTMNVLLPVAAAAATAVPRQGPSAEKARGHGETILIVDDEQSLRTMAGRILAGNGYQVREAADGAAAVRLASEPAGRIDLIVSDVVMPGMLGTEVVDQVRALRPGLPALFITGYAQQVLDSQGVRASDLDIVQKPFSEAALLARVRRALDRAGASRTAPG
jgi:PAS domain S-box-containing protein